MENKQFLLNKTIPSTTLLKNPIKNLQKRLTFQRTIILKNITNHSKKKISDTLLMFSLKSVSYI